MKHAIDRPKHIGHTENHRLDSHPTSAPSFHEAVEIRSRLMGRGGCQVVLMAPGLLLVNKPAFSRSWARYTLQEARVLLAQREEDAEWPNR